MMSADSAPTSTLLRRVRLVRVRDPEPSDHPVDIRIRAGTVTELARELDPVAEDLVLEAAGRWAVPGLWDAHVHLGQWAQAGNRLDLSGTSGPREVIARVRAHLAQSDLDPGTLVLGAGFRSGGWSEQPTVAALDAVTADHPVVLISGDGHNGWLSSAALRLLGLREREGVVDENEWFAVYPRLADLPESQVGLGQAYRVSMTAAAGRGVVGITDMEFEAGFRNWPERFGHGIDRLRVRASTYPDHLEDAISAGLRTGDALLPGNGMLQMGPLKIISDGSLNTRTAHCDEPYRGADALENPHGKQNYSPEQLVALLRRASRSGLEVAVHAIGDAACRIALDAVEVTRAHGAIEHAQLITGADIVRMSALGLRASVQPAHLYDDRDVTARYWPDRADRCFSFRSMLRAGVTLALGSDAPVAPLDPWLAMAAAVHRSADEREPWNPAESLTAAEALAASTDGQPTIGLGSRGDVILLDSDPLAEVGDSAATAAHLRQMRVAATLVAGRPTHLDL